MDDFMRNRKLNPISFPVSNNDNTNFRYLLAVLELQYRKVPFRTQENFAVNYLTFKQRGQTI